MYVISLNILPIGFSCMQMIKLFYLLDFHVCY